MSFLLHNLLHFGRVLHASGLDVPAGRMVDVASALGHVEIGRRSDFYFTLRALLVHRPQDFALFDDAFRVFWRARSGEWSPHDLRAMGERRRIDPTSRDPQPDTGGNDSSVSPEAATETVRRSVALTYSDRETLRTKDFGHFDEVDLRRARLAIARMEWEIGTRRSRRWMSSRAGDPDMRRIVSRYAQSGELMTLPSRRRIDKPRPLVLICDVSGSMERYSRLLLHLSTACRIDRAASKRFCSRRG